MIFYNLLPLQKVACCQECQNIDFSYSPRDLDGLLLTPQRGLGFGSLCCTFYDNCI